MLKTTRRQRFRGRRPRRAAGALLVLLCAAAFPACRSKTEPLNILLVTVDTLRADALGCYGHPGDLTPNIDRLASRGVRFEQARSEVPLTLPSHATILTSLHPISHGLRTNSSLALPDGVHTLAERLQAQGYRTGAVVASVILASQFGLSRGFDDYDDRIAQTPLLSLEGQHADELARRAEEVSYRAIRWIEDRGKDPFFLWVHYFDPHAPYDPPAPFSTRTAQADESRYEGEVAYTDHCLGELLAWMEAEGLLRRTLVVLCSDHGEGLGDHEENTHGVFLYDSTLRVPLIFSLPGRFPEGETIPSQAATIDILPTVLDVLDLEPSASAQGFSLLPEIMGAKREGVRPVFAESLYPKLSFGYSPLRSIVVGQWKLIRGPGFELYNIKEDPGETTNRSAAQPGMSQKLWSRLEKHVQELPAPDAQAAGQPHAGADLETLLALGYLGGAFAAQGSASELDFQGEDPAAHIQDISRMEKAMDLFGANRLQEALALFEACSQEDPANFACLFNQGRIYAALEDGQRARDRFERCLRLDAGNISAMVNLARSYKAEKSYDKAEALMRKAVDRIPGSARYQLDLALILLESGRVVKAVPYLEAAARLAPDKIEPHLFLAEAYVARGEYAKALSSYERALPLAPDRGGKLKARMEQIRTLRK